MNLNLESLEERCVPANINWVGGTSSDWDLGANWQGGVKPGVNDTACFTNGTVNSPVISNIANVEGIYLQANYNGTGLVINSTLNIESGNWELSNKPITGTGKLKITTGKFYWGDGAMGVNKIYAYNGGEFILADNASLLNTKDVYIGEDDGGNPSAGYMRFSDPTHPMNNNITFNNSTDIYVAAQGELSFEQESNCNTSGGIAVGLANNQIINYGKVLFKTADTAGQTLNIGVNIVQDIADGGLIEVGDADGRHVKVKFNNVTNASIVQAMNSTIKLYGDSSLEVNNGGLLVWAGTLEVKDSATSSFTLDGTLDINGSSTNIILESTTVPITLVNLYVNDLIMADGNLKITVDGRTTDACDTIDVSGNIDLTGGTLEVNTVGGAPVVGNKWDFIHHSSKSGTDFDANVWTGLDPGTYTRTFASTYYRLSLPTAGIMGQAWTDTDHDGIHDVGESNKPNVYVALYTSTGTFITGQNTDINGNYSFGSLSAGSYYIIFTFAQFGGHMSPADQGSDDTIDSDAVTITSTMYSVSGQTNTFVLTSGLDHIGVGVY